MVRAALTAAGTRIQAHFDQVFATLDPLPVIAGMRYAMEGGKHLRGYLALESARLHGIEPGRALWPACAIEAIHAYSLIHDDLPCMDDDDLRRGRPTVHIAWDEATAVLAGDALHSLAFEMVTTIDCHPDPAVRAGLCMTLAQAAGARGMVRGQALDIAAETAPEPLTLDQITDLQAGKTGALIEWAALVGPRMSTEEPTALSAYAQALGLAFQIADDILDVEGDSKTAGKRLQKDADAGKATFVSLLGLAGAKARAQELVDTACAALDVYDTEADGLRQTARFVIARDN